MSATITAASARRPKGFSSTWCGPSLHEQRASDRLEPAHRTEVEEAFLLVHSDDLRIVDRRAVQDRREIRIRGHIDTEGERTEGGQDDEPLRDEERGDTHGRPEFVLQLHRGMRVTHDDRMEGRDVLC